ncbi:outer membrane beta-barrel family protein [Flavobacterium sp. B183]|uniref:outer membrane beta-barrel family protein n=1 Tax=Flavobacterium sp. B183 TaxID=907046 RepID=UPI00201EE3EA|nr:outer membrane beta-barrel family protein [Flavobacterium sp. B183]URC14787.1 TonB-dependent receptor [Flavobacterium sp. B183]
MIKSIFIYALVLLCMCSVSAQSLTQVSGTITGEDPNEKLAYASVIIKKDASIVETVITNDKGDFKVEGMKIGKYTVEFQFLSFETTTMALDVDGSKSHINLGTIKLKSNVTSLNEVVVTAETSQLALKLDKKVFDVGKDLISKGGSATQVLDNVPSVRVDPSGSVSLRGNNNVLILINGRKSGLTSIQGLEQIPAESIKSIELITNPSSRYDAAGSAGIINIILKKNNKQDLSGSMTLSTGVPADHRILGSLNYKKGKFNLFSNFGVRYSDYVGLNTRDQVTTADGKNLFLSQREDQDRHDDGGLVYLGLDYAINDDNSITAAFYRNQTKDKDTNTFNYYLSGDGVGNSHIQTIADSQEKRSYNQLEFNYTKTFKKPGRKFTIDAQYDFWNSTKDFNIERRTITPNNGDRSLIDTKSNRGNDDIVVQSDFVTPLSETANLEAGVKVEHRLITTDFAADEEVNGTLKPIDGFNNGLDYKEQILGAYVQYGNKINKFSYQLGLRTEYTSIEIKDQNTRNILIDSTYTRLFPSVNLSYALSDKTTAQLNYSQRINRPNLFQLNPFPELQDFNSRIFGNIRLVPSITDGIELGLLSKTKKWVLNPSVYYSKTQNNFQYFTSQNSDDVFETVLINLDEESRFGVELSAQYAPAKWLSLNAVINAYSFDQKGSVGTTNLDYSNETWTATLLGQVKFPKNFTLQSKFEYQAPVSDAQTRTKSFYYLNMALGKSLFNNNATLTLGVSNIFNTRKTRETTVGSDFVVNQMTNFNAARWNLNFNYRFNKAKSRKEHKSNRE